jgi:hypothetical protein
MSARLNFLYGDHVRPELERPDVVVALDFGKLEAELAIHVDCACICPTEHDLQGHEHLGHLAPDPLELNCREATRLIAVRRFLHDLVLGAVRGGSVLACLLASCLELACLCACLLACLLYALGVRLACT